MTKVTVTGRRVVLLRVAIKRPLPLVNTTGWLCLFV